MEVLGQPWIEQREPGKRKSACRKWRVRVRTNQGKKSRNVYGTYTQAKEKALMFAEELENDVGLALITFGEYADRWFKWRKGTNNFSPNTLEHNERMIKRLNFYLQDTLLTQITTTGIKTLILEITDNQGKPMSNTYKNMHFRTLRLILNNAVQDGYLKTNPMNTITIPKSETPEKSNYTKEEFDILIEALDNTKNDVRIIPIYLMAYLGLRRGEVIALKWHNIDFKTNIIKITEAYKNADGTIGPPKTKAGLRTLPMPIPLRKRLDLWKTICKNEQINSEFVCVNTYHKQISPTMLRKWWPKFCKKNNLRRISFHELRHTNLTFAARYMSAYDLKNYAGWSSLAPTKIYIHDDQEMLTKAIHKMF